MSSINNVTNKWEKNKIQNFYTSVNNSNREIILFCWKYWKRHRYKSSKRKENIF